MMKSVSKGRVTTSEETGRQRGGAGGKLEDVSDPMVDESVVMVMFPRETWGKIEEMAQHAGMRPVEIISVAIELLDEKFKRSKSNGA